MDAHGQKYFITFIDDYLRFMYLYMLHNKNETLDAFKVFKVEVEKQCGKLIKIVKIDRGVEYYGRYTEVDKHLDHLRTFFKRMGLLPNIPCMVLRTRMVFQKKETKL